MKIPKTIYTTTALITVIALYGPLLLVFVFSFNTAQRGMLWEGFSLRWYRDIWSDHILISSILNTAKVAGLTCIISLIGGLGCGYLISLAEKKAFIALSSILFLPILTPDLIASLALSLFYQLLGIEKGLHTIAFSQSFFGIAYVALFVSTRLRSMDFKQYLLAASSLGASPTRAFNDHFLPLALPAAFSGAGVVAALSIQDFLYSFFCGGAGSTTLSVKLYSMVKFGVNSSINVIYVLLIASVITLFLLSEIYLGKERHL